MKRHGFILFSLITFIAGYIVYKIKVSEDVVENEELNDEKEEVKVNKESYVEDFKKFNEYNYKKRNYITLKGKGENF